MKRPRSFVQDLYRALSNKLGARLLDEMLNASSLRPKLTLARVGAFLLATLVYLIALGMFVVGAWMIWRTFPNFFLVPIGLALVLMAIAARPRVPPFPKAYATREDYPEFFAFTGRVAQTLNTRNVQAVVWDWSFNASFGQYGWRRRAVLTIGLPLFETLTDQERVALVAHELAHGVNGDPNRGFYIGTAFYSVMTWYAILHVRQIEVSSIPGTFANLLMRALSTLPWLLGMGLAYLMWRDKQRAEYLADYLAAQVSGKEAKLGLLRKLQRETNFEHVLHNIAFNAPNADLFEEIKRQMAASAHAPEEHPAPRDEYELDSSHPPTDYRIRFIQARGAPTAAFVLSEAESERLAAELLPAKKAVQEKLVDRYLRTKYY